MPQARPPFPLRTVALAATVVAVSIGVQAQTAPAPQRIEITGSSLKRLDVETALPVQIIKRDDIDKAGITTAAELVRNISANTAPLGDGASITDSSSGQRGFNGANLRGIGVSSTLILLNGRRLANFATPGDNAGVDLNNIPAGAIDRVEVLKDGASAIYGTDAIGGVINFITRKDWRGLELRASAAATQEGGAGKRTVTLSGGAGDHGSDGWNVIGVLDLQQLDALRSTQRDFIRERPLAEVLPALMSSNTYPANIDINTAQRNALIAAGLLPAGSTRNRINPSSPDCNPPATVYAPEGPGGPLACSYDYMQDTEIYPASDKTSFFGRGTLALPGDHTLYGEVMLSQAVTDYVLSPNPIRIRNLPVSVLPQAYRDVLSAAGLPTTVSGIRYRMAEAGNRTSEVTSSGTRFVAGVNGTFGAWDYDLALSRAENRSTDRYTDGYVLFDAFDAAVRNGTVNPFGPSSAAGLALIDSITIDDKARRSVGTTTSLDGKLTRGLFKMDGGEAAIAIGGEWRREQTRFKPSALLLSNNIAGDRDSGLAPGETDPGLVATKDSRSVASVFTELGLPISKALEAQLALRYDRYSDAGDTINPKAALRWQPNVQWLVRGSVGTGFRAPSLADLNRPTTFGVTSSLLTDPQCAELDGIDLCTDQWPVERRSNPDLKPEKSTQFSLGAVFAPATGWNISLDYWAIQKKDVISTLGEQIIIESPEKYNGTYIERDEDGFITNILLRKENQGRLKTSGLDIGVDWRSARGDWGRFGVGLNGTLVLEYKRQFGPLEPYRSNLGVFLNDQVVQRWRHRIAFDWDLGNFGLTLANQYSSGYTDHNQTYDPVTDTLLPARKVKAYSLWDLNGSWDVNKALKLRAGIQNLLDTPPPFSNQSYYFLAGWDPTHTDPKGRTYTVSVQYAFR
jgi:iron complex outermembrane recepter protein